MSASSITNSLGLKNYLKAHYKQEFFVEKEGRKIYVFTKELSLPEKFVTDLKSFNSKIKINWNKLGLSLEDWQSFLEHVSVNESETGLTLFSGNETTASNDVPQLEADPILEEPIVLDDVNEEMPEPEISEEPELSHSPIQLSKNIDNIEEFQEGSDTDEFQINNTAVEPKGKQALSPAQISGLAELEETDAEALPYTFLSNPFLVNKGIEKFLYSRKDKNLPFTYEEKLFLKKYTGYGGLEKHGAKGKELLYEYYTPEKIITKMWELAFKNGYHNGPVLEPSMGIGDFLKYVPEGVDCTGYEINSYSFQIAKILYPDFELHQNYFESRFIKNNESLKSNINHLPKFDLVIGNPPYGDFTGRYAGMGEKGYTKALSYVEYFILRGLDCLNPGGLLIYIIGVEVANGGIPFLQQGMTKAKELILEKGELLEDTYRLANGLFDRTDVLCDIVIFKRK
ncbi:MAG: N-6 DNA methylase [Sporocytophaga sp.]|nr:N-6 DNA methylase [Sporocytophaga sp.]